MLRRRLVALTLVLSSSSIGSVALLPESPASAKAVTVKAPWSSPGSPVGTEVITLRGSIGRTVPRWARLERRTHGHWALVRRAKLTRAGTYAFRLAMPAPAQSFRVVSAAVRAHGRVFAQRVSRVRTVYRAIQTANVAVPQQMRVGTPATIGLAFAPARPGRPAALQVNENGAGWRTLANLAQDRSGRAAYAYVPPTNGTVEFRAVALASAGAPQLTGPAAKGYALPTKRMYVAAHRGFSSFYAENTLKAYAGALNQATPADWLETDFQKTAADTPEEVGSTACNPATPADGTWQKAVGPLETGKSHWIALHNEGLLATTNVETVFPKTDPRWAPKYDANGVPVVDRFTLCEIKQLDAGSWKNAESAGQKVPTLEETLDLFTTYSRVATKLMVEPKLSTGAEAVELYDAIRAYDDAHTAQSGYRPFVPADQASHEDRALFDTFDIDAAKKLSHDRPAAEVASIADSVSPVDETDPSQFPAGVAVFLKNELVTRARVDAIHATDPRKQVIVWTVNDPDRWLELASLGVDVVITDNSKGARTFLTGTD